MGSMPAPPRLQTRLQETHPGGQGARDNGCKSDTGGRRHRGRAVVHCMPTVACLASSPSPAPARCFPAPQLRYANNSNYKNDTMIRKECFVSQAVLDELRRIIEDSEVGAAHSLLSSRC